MASIPPAAFNRPLHDELVAMQARDQAVRSEWANEGMKNDPALIARWSQIDGQNLARMRQIVAQYGWPDDELVGKDGQDAAWTLVQHGDADPTFQAYCLPKMKAAADRGEADKQNLALLTDRVLLAEGKKQLYGSQFMWTDAKHTDLEPRPTQDPAHLNQRRAAMGLGTIAEYKREIIDLYKLQVKR